MFNLHTYTPSLLKPGQCIQFESPSGKVSNVVPAGVPFRIIATRQLKYIRSFIIPAEDYTMVELDNGENLLTKLNLYPTSPDIIYQIVVGIKGSNDILIYPQIPSNTFLLKLDSGYVGTPDPDNPLKAYIGCIKASDSPPDNPKLEIFTVVNMETIYLLLANEGSVDGKIVFEFLVNKCKVVQETAPSPGCMRIVSYDYEL